MSFNGNINLNKSGEKIQYAEWQILEIIKCANDPIYFIKNYIYIINLDKGKIKFELYDFQENMINMIHNNKRIVGKLARQSGKTTSMAAYLCHYVIFNRDKTAAILANKESTAREILYRIKIMIENLPSWLQPGILEWNKSSVELENGSKIITSATSSSAIRGRSVSFLALDEFAFISPGVFEDFIQSVYPTVSSSKEAKIIMISTPWGLNHFYKFWMDAINGINGFSYFEIEWNDIPGRDEAWKEKTISEIGLERFQQEFASDFIGSSNTLVDTKYIKNFVYQNPIHKNGYLKIFEKPDKSKLYCIISDVGEGVGGTGDYSTVQVIDVTELPYKQVATYKNNEIKPHLFANVINNIGLSYNKALVIVENNSIGMEVLNNLNFNEEYENIFFLDKKFGLRMTKGSKNMGCSHLKSFLETGKLILVDLETVNELSTFCKKKNGTFSAEAGKKDDLITPLILFSYFISKDIWVDRWLDKENIMKEIYKTAHEEIEENLLPVGFFPSSYESEEDV